MRKRLTKKEIRALKKELRVPEIPKSEKEVKEVIVNFLKKFTK